MIPLFLFSTILLLLRHFFSAITIPRLRTIVAVPWHVPVEPSTMPLSSVVRVPTSVFSSSSCPSFSPTLISPHRHPLRLLRQSLDLRVHYVQDRRCCRLVNLERFDFCLAILLLRPSLSILSIIIPHVAGPIVLARSYR